MKLERTKKSPLYKTVADSIATMVDNGTFKPGERVPSIRELSRQFQVSINTVKVAYCSLEDRCVIEARPQSGYFVCTRLPAIPKEPDISQPEISPLDISTEALVMRIMRDVLDPEKVQFGAAIPDPALVPAEKLSRILAAETRNHRNDSIAYAMPPGNKRLRTQIARRMLKAGCTLNPDEVIITTGASEAVFLALRALCKPGDTVAIGSPIYFTFVEMLKAQGLRVIEIPSSPTEGLHLETLRLALEHNTVQACLVISNFNNPLGNSLSDGRKAELVQLLADWNVPLIEDDINGDLSFADDRPSVAKAWDRTGSVLLCSSFSKTLAPGYRVGWIAPGRFYEQVLHNKMVTNMASASPTQLAMGEFLTNGGYEHHLRSIRKTYAAKVVRMAEAVGVNFPPGTRVTRPQGGFTLWCELPGRLDSVQLYAMAQKKQITVAPGTIFSTSGKYSNCLRLNAAFWSEENRWAIEVLGKMTRSMGGGKSKDLESHKLRSRAL